VGNVSPPIGTTSARQVNYRLPFSHPLFRSKTQNKRDSLTLALVSPVRHADNGIMLHCLFRLLWVAAVLPAIFFCTPIVRANGCYIPQQAYPAMPSIPVQRAIIVHRDGQETLVVESGVQSPSPTVGWILPLPAEPTRLEKADPGMLISASMSLRPWLIHDLRHPWETILWVFGLFFGTPLAALALFKEPYARRSKLILVVWFFCLLTLVGLFLPSLGVSSRSDAIGDSGVTLLSVQKVGDYDTTVLKARSGDDLSQWLTHHGLRALPDTARPIVDSYIKDNWCFPGLGSAPLRQGACCSAPDHGDIPGHRSSLPHAPDCHRRFNNPRRPHRDLQHSH